jgi:transcriptional regulator with XRE-family HTH domain
MEVLVSQPSPSFGEELRKRRMDAGLSLSALAVAVHFSKPHLSKVERGLKSAGRDLARLCDGALEAGKAIDLRQLAPRLGTLTHPSHS